MVRKAAQFADLEKFECDDFVSKNQFKRGDVGKAWSGLIRRTCWQQPLAGSQMVRKTAAKPQVRPRDKFRSRDNRRLGHAIVGFSYFLSLGHGRSADRGDLGFGGLFFELR
jgi:hypothetical protein